MRRSLQVLGILLCGGLPLGCGGGAPASIAGAPSVPPDDQFETDGGFAWRVLAWRCHAGRHIVMSQTCGEGCTGCGGWSLESTPCGVLTPVEHRIAGRGRAPIPSGYGWR